ncbi:MAG: MIP family channel protein [Nocardioides sp.]
MTDATAAAVEAPAPPTTVQKALAEVIGTFVLVFFGCGSVVIAGLRIQDVGGGGDDGTLGLSFIVSIGLTFGLAVMVMIYAFGRISGGHFNPAVTVGAAIGGRIAWNQVPVYIGAQLGGAVLGGAVLLGVALGFESFDAFDTTLGTNGWGDDGTGYALWAALVLELILTAIFVLVILAVTDERNEHPGLAPLTIGFTLAAIHFVAIPATGTSVNPARSIGPAVFSGTDPLIQVWVFILAPLLGGAAAGLLYPAVFGHASDPVPGSGLNFRRPAVGAVPGYGAPDQYQQQWNQQGGYQQPAAQQAAPADQYQQQWNQPQQPVASQAAAPAQEAQPAQTQQQWGEQPIIQDGWQWDPQAQQWIPAQQQPPVQPGQQSPVWPTDQGGEQTQVRPPDQP